MAVLPAKFPGPYAPTSNEIQQYQTNYAFSPGQLLTTQDIKQISPTYATNKTYISGIQQGENLISTLQKDPAKFAMAQTVVQTAMNEGKNPRLVLAQILHETTGFTKMPNNNPGGVKPSAVTKKFIKENPNFNEIVLSLQPTREDLNTENPDVISHLKDMFSNPRTKFVVNPMSPADIIKLAPTQIADLNSQLDLARQTNDTNEWKILNAKLKVLKELNPQEVRQNSKGVSYKTNVNFWVTQPFMNYPDLPAGTQDVIRAQSGKTDTSMWKIDPQTNRPIRVMPSGKEIKY